MKNQNLGVKFLLYSVLNWRQCFWFCYTSKYLSRKHLTAQPTVGKKICMTDKIRQWLHHYKHYYCHKVNKRHWPKLNIILNNHNVWDRIKWFHLSGRWRRRWRQVRFCESHPCNNANCQNYPSKYVILQITTLLFLLRLTKNKQNRW